MTTIAEPQEAQIVRVGLAERAYDIVIGHGLIAEAGQRIAAAFPGTRVAIVTDKNVAEKHLAALEASLGVHGRLDFLGLQYCFDTEDREEGIQSFLEKRPAEFTGR